MDEIEDKLRPQELTWRQYEEGLNFQRKQGFNTAFPEYERFKQGEQWPSPTQRTKSLPRPVFNIVRMFVNSKKSSVLNQNIKILYTPVSVSPKESDFQGSALFGNSQGFNQLSQELSQEAAFNESAVQGASDYTDFAQNLWGELDQDTLNDLMVEDAATDGTGILHYYWDSSIKGGSQAPYVGSLRGEIIDPLNIFFANPQEINVQKQSWIIISSRQEVSQVKKFAKSLGLKNTDIELIRGDDDTSALGYDTAKREQEENSKITVLTKYFKGKDGEVYYSKSTRDVLLIEKESLTPKIEKGEDDFDIEEETAPITLYPIVVFNWQNRKKCIFGVGEVEGLIPNQKAINFNIAMMLLSVQDNAWPKIIAKPGALRQKITNTPGEILTDYFSGGDGVKYMQPPNFNYMAVNLVDKVMDLSRTTSGVTEVSTGEQIGSNMAASAIIALQNQAKVPIDNIQKRFYRSIKEVGKIWEQFFKTYFNMPRTITTEDTSGNNVTRTFTGDKYKDVEFKLKIDVGPSSSYSEALAMSTLDKMYDKGDINVDQYIELAPENVMPFKEKLKKLREGIVQQVPQDGGGFSRKEDENSLIDNVLAGGKVSPQMVSAAQNPLNNLGGVINDLS